jgi:hypothetical protein
MFRCFHFVVCFACGCSAVLFFSFIFGRQFVGASLVNCLYFVGGCLLTDLDFESLCSFVMRYSCFTFSIGCV